jgi:hypothetical protein
MIDDEKTFLERKREREKEKGRGRGSLGERKGPLWPN